MMAPVCEVVAALLATLWESPVTVIHDESVTPQAVRFAIYHPYKTATGEVFITTPGHFEMSELCRVVIDTSHRAMQG